MTGSMLVSNEQGSATLTIPVEGIVPKETIDIARAELVGWKNSRSPNEYQINFLLEFLIAAGSPDESSPIKDIPVHNPVDLSTVEAAQLQNQIANINNLPGGTDPELEKRVQAIHAISVPVFIPAGLGGNVPQANQNPAPGSIHDKLAAMKATLKSIT